MNKLLAIQSELKAPKDLLNKFGGYKYRSCESILEALKPHLQKHGLVLCLHDDMVAVGNRIYVKSTALLQDSDKTVASVTAFAREEEVKKGMDSSQITGAASSYARKYALNGMFLIDDARDSDSTNDHSEKPATARTEATKPPTSAPKHDPHTAGAMSPSAGNQAVRGVITSEGEPNAGGYIAFTLDGVQREDGKEMKFSTREKAVIAVMRDNFGTQHPVDLEYKPNDNPRFAANIVGVKPVIEDSVPF